MTNSGTPQSSELKDEKTLSYILEHDEDYGSKLSKLLAYNSKGVPVLGIKTIQFQRNFAGSSQDLESFLENYFSDSEILIDTNKEARSNTNFEIEDFLSSIEEPKDQLQGQSQDLQIQDDLSEHDSSETESPGSSSQEFSQNPNVRPPTPHNDQNGKHEIAGFGGNQCVKTDHEDINFGSDQELAESDVYEDLELVGDISGVEESELKEEGRLGEFFTEADADMGTRPLVLDFDTNQRNENFSCSSLGLYFENIYGDNLHTCSSGGASFPEKASLGSREDLLAPCGVAASEMSEEVIMKLSNEGSELEKRSQSGKSGEIDEKDSEIGEIRGGEAELGVRHTQVNQKQLPRPFSANQGFEKPVSSEVDWKMKIENIMHGDRKLGSPDVMSQSIGLTLEKNSCRSLCSERAAVLTSDTGNGGGRDLKTGIIQEIENELRGCKLSLGFFRSENGLSRGKNSIKRTPTLLQSEQESFLALTLALDHSELDLNLDLDLNLNLSSEKEFDSESESNIGRNTIYLPDKSLIAANFTQMDTCSNFTATQPCIFSLESIDSDDLIHNQNSTPRLSRIDRFSVSQLSDPKPRIQKETEDHSINRSQGLHALLNTKDAQPAEGAHLAQTLVLSRGRENMADNKSLVSTPENIVMSIRLLAAVRDIKRQIRIIRSKLL